MGKEEGRRMGKKKRGGNVGGGFGDCGDGVGFFLYF